MLQVYERPADYLAVVHQYSHYAYVLCEEDRCVRRMSNEVLKQAKHVALFEGEEPRNLTGKTQNYRQYLKAGNPRVYIGFIRMFDRHCRVVLPDYSELLVPNGDMDTWHSYKNFEYYLLMDKWQYPNGRKLEDLTFGIEFEFSGLADSAAKQRFVDDMKQLLGERFDPDAYAGPYCWTLGHDSSIHNKKDYFGYELQSPILHHTDSDYQIVCEVLDLVKKHLDAKVNASCGTHIHFGNFVDGSRGYKKIMDDSSLRWEYIEKFKGLSLCYGRLERVVFDRLVDRSRRQDNNEYCESCMVWKDERHRKINLECYEDNGSLENRHHGGTLDAEDIWHWMEVVGRFVLKYFEDPQIFDDVADLETFFDRIDLDESIRQYYLHAVEEMRERTRRQVECLMQHADYRRGEDRADEVPSEICLRQIDLNHERACA